MTVQELHLQVNQRLQEVASYKKDKMFPQEIDMALNKAMFRLLEDAVEKKFSDTQVHLSHVAALMKKNQIAEAYIPETFDPLYEENLESVYSVLAPDLYWLINGRVEVITDPLNCSTAPDLGTTQIPENRVVVPFPAANPTPPYFVNVRVTSSSAGTLYAAPTAINAGFNSRNSSYVIINNILESFRNNTVVKCYWERYRDVYYPNSFIFVSVLTLGTVSITGTGLTTSSASQTTTFYDIYDRGLIASLPSKKVELRPVKVNEPNLLYSSLKENQFYATRVAEVAADQTYDFVSLYVDNSFIVTRFYYDYIRKPRTISLSLGQSCELADTAHPRVVDLAVEILRLDTKDQAYQQTVQDTQLRTN